MTLSSEVSLQKPRKVTIVESIVEQFVDQVQQGKLKPGDRLPSERQLIEMLGVSRSSVREALQGLSVMGLVESRPGQGSFISLGHSSVLCHFDSPALADHLERKMRLQLVEARRAIEPTVARLAAERATPEGLAALRQSFEGYRRKPFSEPAGPLSLSQHALFHLSLAEMSGNPFFVAVVDQLLRAVPETLRRREVLGRDDQDVQKTISDEMAMHQAIIAAVANKDGEAAAKAMDYHLDYERRLIVQLFPEEEPEHDD